MTFEELVGGARLPRVFTGRLSATERADSVDALHVVASKARAGTNRAKFMESVIGALIGVLGEGYNARQLAKAAEDARKAAEMALAASAEGE